MYDLMSCKDGGFLHLLPRVNSSRCPYSMYILLIADYILISLINMLAGHLNNIIL